MRSMILVHFTQTGTAQNTPTTVDERDLIDVTDPVRQIAADALSTWIFSYLMPNRTSVSYQMQRLYKRSSGCDSDLPEVSNLSRLKKNVTKTGNIDSKLLLSSNQLVIWQYQFGLVPTSYFLILSVKSELLRMSSRLAEKKQVEQPVFPEREAVFQQSEPGPSRKCMAETQAAPDDVYTATMYQPKWRSLGYKIPNHLKKYHHKQVITLILHLRLLTELHPI